MYFIDIIESIAITLKKNSLVKNSFPDKDILYNQQRTKIRCIYIFIYTGLGEIWEGVSHVA